MVKTNNLPTCDDLKVPCPVCCAGQPAVCTDDSLHCDVNDNDDFSILYTMAVWAFVGGVGNILISIFKL